MRENFFEPAKLQRYPYLCDFLLLEILDAIWITEIYKPHMDNIIEIIKKEVRDVHSVERYDELAEKKEIFRKSINVVNQMDFNLNSNNILLSIARKEGFTSDPYTDINAKPKCTYPELKEHVRASVRQLLKQFQR